MDYNSIAKMAEQINQEVENLIDKGNYNQEYMDALRNARASIDRLKRFY